MNAVTIVGRLTRDPELTERGERKVCDLRIAESSGREDTPLFIDVATFGPQAETCAEYLQKGRLVAVEGRLRYSEWESTDGSKRSRHSVIARRVEFLDSKRSDEPAEASEDQAVAA